MFEGYTHPDKVFILEGQKPRARPKIEEKV